MVANVGRQNFRILRTKKREHRITEPATFFSVQGDLRRVYEMLQGFSPVLILEPWRGFRNRVPERYQKISVFIQLQLVPKAAMAISGALRWHQVEEAVFSNLMLVLCVA